MSKITQGCMVMLIRSEFLGNIGAIGTVLCVDQVLSDRLNAVCWFIEFNREVTCRVRSSDLSDGIVTKSKKSAAKESQLLYICPPPREMIPDPVKAPVDEVPA